jgi:hypothetical protein
MTTPVFATLQAAIDTTFDETTTQEMLHNLSLSLIADKDSIETRLVKAGKAKLETFAIELTGSPLKAEKAAHMATELWTRVAETVEEMLQEADGAEATPVAQTVSVALTAPAPSATRAPAESAAKAEKKGPGPKPQNTIDQLLEKLADAKIRKDRTAQKGLRAALRRQGYFISRIED